MKMSMRSPCANCPFRTDIPVYLHAERRRDICQALLDDHTFACHKTLEGAGEEETRVGRSSAHCAGALIFLALQDRMNQAMRFYGRLERFDIDRLDLDAPVYRSLEAMVRVPIGELPDPSPEPMAGSAGR